MPPAAAPSPNTGNNKSFLKQMEDFFYTYLHKKAPFHIPPNGREAIVKIGPWIALVLMILALPAILVALGLSAIFAPAAYMYGGYHTGAGFMLQGLLSLMALVMQAIALPGLFKRALKSWYLLYYAALISAVAQLLGGQVIGMLVGLIISLYILFEIKEYYK